jgi:hypothetical protein
LSVVYAQCRYYLNVVLIVAMFNVIILSFVMLNVVMLNVTMLYVVMLNAVMLSVMAPAGGVELKR